MNTNEITQLHEHFARTTEEIISLTEWNSLLVSGKKLRVKYGVDVTAPNLHIGHAVNLWMLRHLQDLGHKVLFLIGDFTTRIGDPTGKNKMRPVISQEDIENNTQEFIKQAQMVLRFDDPNLLEIRKNSEWLDQLSITEFLKLLSLVTHSKMISRDMFQKRIQEGEEVYMHELLYPVLQGYDSYVLNADLTIIGSDQLFNEMMGRFYQEKLGQRPQVIITTKITPGIDGKTKQSKSLDNYVGLGHSPRDKFGRIMKLPDNLITDYFRIYTGVSNDSLKDITTLSVSDPLATKKALAREIVSLYHGSVVSEAESEWFEQTFSRKKFPTGVPSVKIKQENIVAIDLLKEFFGATKSNSELRRLFEGGAVSIQGIQIKDCRQVIRLKNGDTAQVGKRVWFNVSL